MVNATLYRRRTIGKAATVDHLIYANSPQDADNIAVRQHIERAGENPRRVITPIIRRPKWGNVNDMYQEGW